MADYEKWIHHEGPCMCNQGIISVVCYSPNFAGRMSYEATMTCASCRQEYALMNSGGNTWLEKISEQKRSRDLTLAVCALRDRLKQEYITPLAHRLESLAKESGRTIMDWHMCLRTYFDLPPVATFRTQVRKRGNIGAWLDSNITSKNIMSVLTSIGEDRDGLSELLQEIERAEHEAAEFRITRIAVPVAE